jgi:hypothetical protein
MRSAEPARSLPPASGDAVAIMLKQVDDACRRVEGLVGGLGNAFEEKL